MNWLIAHNFVSVKINDLLSSIEKTRYKTTYN